MDTQLYVLPIILLMVYVFYQIYRYLQLDTKKSLDLGDRIKSYETVFTGPRIDPWHTV